MMKEHFKKLLVIFVGVIFTLSYITISNSYAQEKTVNIGADKIKAILLKQNGWIGEWNCGQGRWQALTNLIFEDHGKKIVVKIHDEAFTDSCKRKVTITSDGFKMASCYSGILQLIFDPNDNRYPFKTKGDNQECDLKIKVK
jgi:hypothetical protein